MLQLLGASVTSCHLCLLATTLGAVYVFLQCLTHPKDMPPIPTWRMPILGHLPFFSSLPHLQFIQWKKKCGDIFTVYLGSTPNIVITSRDLIHDAFVKQADIFSDRPTDCRVHFFPDTTKGIINNSGPSWKEQRCVAMAILKAFGVGKNVLAEKIAQEVQAYTDVLHAFQHKPQDPSTLTSTAVSNVICSLLVGQRFEYDDQKFIHFVHLNNRNFKFVFATTALNFLPFLRHLPGDLFGAKQHGLVISEVSQVFSSPYIQKFKQEMDDTTNDNYIKAYLREMRKRKEAGMSTTLDETNLRRHIDDLFLAGSETSATTILWAMVYVLNYPDVQRKIQAELDDVVGRDRTPDLHNKAKLTYLGAFILEVQRLASVAPVGGVHLCNRTTQLGGYRIPQGAVILSSLYSVMHDDKTWTDPETFRPERFMDGESGKLRIPQEFIPFNIGKRYCLGESLAKMELFLFLSAIFHRFELHPEDPTSPPSMVPIATIVLKPQPFKIRIKERSVSPA